MSLLGLGATSETPKLLPAPFAPLPSLRTNLFQVAIAMTTAAEIAHEIGAVGELLAARGRGAEDRLAEPMMGSLRHKILNLQRFDASAALVLQKALNTAATALEPWLDGLLKAVESRLQNPTALDLGAVKTSKPQELTNLAVYLTAQDWDRLEAPGAVLQGKLVAVAERIARLGVRYASEQTIKGAVALVLATTYELEKLPPPATLHGLVKELKRLLDVQKRPPVPWVQRYPASPQELDPSVRTAAYVQEEPALRELAAHSAYTLKVPLRSTSKLLKEGGVARPPALLGGWASH